MDALTKENTRAAVELRNDDTFRAVDDERTLFSHIGYLTQVHALYGSVEILMLRVGAVQLQFRLQRHAVRKTTLETFLYAVTRRIYVIVQEFQHEIVSGVSNGEIFGKYLVKTLVLAMLRRSVQLEKITEGL